MNAFQDSQASEDDAAGGGRGGRVGSQDLFNNEAPVDFNRVVLDRLQDICNRLNGVEEEMRRIRGALAPQRKFAMEKCSFKSKYFFYLKERFSRNPWISSENTDNDIKSEIVKMLREDGFDNDALAFQAVLSFSSTSFVRLRNQLRRKLLEDFKSNKFDVRGMELMEFTRHTFSRYCQRGEDPCQKSRLEMAMLYRSYMHKHYLRDQPDQEDGEGKSFWSGFHDLWMEVDASQRVNKWEKLTATDARRVQRHLDRNIDNEA